MMPVRLSPLMLVVVMLSLPGLAQGQEMDTFHQSSTSQSQAVGVVIHSTTIDRSQWSLTDEDWERYDQIMLGPRRFWSPGVDPLTVLGAEARTEAERRRYAEMLVEQERTRTAGELALARAYSDAWVRMYGMDELLDGARLGIEEVIPFDAVDRIAIFLDSNCVACTNIIERVTGYLAKTPWPGLDLYFLDEDEQAIQQWTAKAGVPLEMVESGRVTINYDDGVLAHLQSTSAPQFPVAYRRRGDEFSPVEMNYLLREDLYGISAGTAATSNAAGSRGLIDQLKGLFQ